jgi:hypothetical protein
MFNADILLYLTNDRIVIERKQCEHKHEKIYTYKHLQGEAFTVGSGYGFWDKIPCELCHPNDYHTYMIEKWFVSYNTGYPCFICGKESYSMSEIESWWYKYQKGDAIYPCESYHPEPQFESDSDDDVKIYNSDLVSDSDGEDDSCQYEIYDMDAYRTRHRKLRM